MAHEALKVGILWMVRELQPISFDEMRDMLGRKDARLPAVYRDAAAQRAMYSAFNYVDDLLKAGLIKTVNDEALKTSSKLVTTPALGLVQDIFAISLTEQMKRTEASMLMTPLFGKPLAKNQASGWAEIFVAMPFQEDLKPIYTDHIQKVATGLGLSCKRGDDFFTANSIIGDVWSAIYHAKLCIVDCTGRNPNVFYELGMTHTLGRKAITIAQKMEDIPFDIQHLRTIIYENTRDGMEELEEVLTETIRFELGIRP